jgi:Zn-dependent protease/CBS domain-containing protein
MRAHKPSSSDTFPGAPAARAHAARPAATDPHPTASRGARLGRVAGIEIRLDWSLIVIFALIAINLGAGLFPLQHPGWSPLLAWTTAFVAAVLFLASVLAHELAHALVGRHYGLPIDRITLFMFGGMTELRAEPRSPGVELATAIVGPLTSLAIGVGSLLIGAAAVEAAPAAAEHPRAFIASLSPAATLLLWLGPVNVFLAVFNLLPGFPLDGGRVFRALLWRTTGDFEKATRWSTAAGRGLGFLLMAVGAFMIFGQRVPGLGGGVAQGLWLVFIGWFLSSAAAASYQQVLLRRLFEGVRVSRLMRPASRPIDAQASLEAAADAFLQAESVRCLPVVEGGEAGRFAGLVCLSDLARTPRASWARRTVGDVMTPLERLAVARPSEEVSDALQKLARADVDQLPVVEAGEVRGLLRRADVLRWLELQRSG